ncbi:MAG TPA: hypothetical protein VJH04_02190 [archaeon]|nr:hypothetical protein [archaeon]
MGPKEPRAYDHGQRYGLLTFAIFGDDHLHDRKDRTEAIAEYHRMVGKGMTYAKFDNWFRADLLEVQILPEDFIRSIDTALDNLHPSYKEAVQMRFGLLDGRPMTFREMGPKLHNMKTGNVGVTSYRASYMNSNAIHELREPSNAEIIKASLTDNYLRSLFGFNR